MVGGSISVVWFVPSAAIIAELRRVGLPTNRRPCAPGEIIRRDFLEPLGLSPLQLAEAMEIQPMRLRHLLQGAITMNADLAVRLSKTLGCSPAFWLNLQTGVDMYDAILASEGWTLRCINSAAKPKQSGEEMPSVEIEVDEGLPSPTGSDTPPPPKLVQSLSGT